MHKIPGKALYVFLCSLLGMILFSIFYQSLVVIYFALLNANFALFSLGWSDYTFQVMRWSAALAALFIGGWYGTGLGLHWYKIVYEDNPDVGMFHGFIPHHWRKPTRQSGKQTLQKTEREVPLTTAPLQKKIVVETPETAVGHSKRIQSFDAFESFQPVTHKTVEAWSLDDIEKKHIDVEYEPELEKPAAVNAKTKRVSEDTPKVKKTVRKVLIKPLHKTTESRVKRVKTVKTA